MKIAFIIPEITAGGAERVVTRLAGYLTDHGVRVFIFVTNARDVYYDIHPDVTLVKLKSLNAPQLKQAISTHGIDIISDHFHWTLHHILELKKLADTGIKIILSEHNSYFYPLLPNSDTPRIEGLTLYNQRASLYRSFAAVTTLTRYSANLLVSEGLDNVVLAYNPLSYETEALADLGPPRLLNVSSFLKSPKRLDGLFQAFGEVSKLYPGVRLRILGEFDYPLYAKYCRDSGTLENSVEIIGLCHDVTEHYLASSIFAMTSEIEGQPMALLEAANHGIPQIVYDIPGIEDQILHGETGYIVPPGDSAQFAAVADNLLRDKTLRRRIGARAREFVQDRFGMAKIGADWLCLLQQVHDTGAPTADTRWSLNGVSSDQIRADALPEINRWLYTITIPTKPPKVSIIVPVYGTEEFLARCLDSLIMQTMKEIEIIVVNDGSPGNFSELMETYRDKDRRIIFIEHSQNRGLYQARSTGARHARGDFLAHVDSDDFVHSEFIRLMYETALADDADIVECAAIEISTKGERKPFSPTFERELVQPALLEAFIDEKIRHVVWNKLYRKSTWDRAALHMEETHEFSITEDLLRNAPIFAAAEKYRFIEAVLYYYIRRDDSVVTRGNFSTVFKKLDDLSYVYDTVINFYRRLEIPEQKLDRIRERELTDYGWYLCHGHSNDAGSAADRIRIGFEAGGIFCAVAIHQATQLAQAEDLKYRYRQLGAEHRALQARLKAAKT